MNEYIREVAEYVIANHTISETAKHFAKSKSSINKYLAIVRDKNNPNHDQILAKRLQLAQTKIYLEGVKKGGSIGKRERTYTQDEIRKLADLYLTGLTYEELSIKTGIPKSTLQEIIRSLPDTELQSRIDAYVNKR